MIKHENHTPAPVCISLHASKPSGTCTAGKTLCPLSQQSHPKYRWFKSKMQKKRNTKHLQNVQDVVIIPICRPTLHLCHTIPLPYRILLVMGPPKKCQAAGQRWHVLWLTQSPRFSRHTLRYSNMICWKIHHLRRTFQ